MPDMSMNVPSNIVYSAIGAESWRIARHNPYLFSSVIKPLVICMSREEFFIKKINSVIIKKINRYKILMMEI